MDWSKIIKFAKSKGYTGGDVDAVAVGEFLKAKGLELADESGEAIDLAASAAAFSAKSKVSRVVLTDDGADEALKAENAALREQARKAASGALRMAAGVEDDQRKAPQPFAIGNGAKKSYNRKAQTKRGATSFADADEAELFGAWVASTLMPERTTKSMRDLVQKANISTTNTSGGFAVPDLFVPAMIDLKELRGAARQVLSVMPVGRDRVEFPRRTGGVTVYWPGEAASITESNPAGNNVGVTANKMTALTTVSNELINDSLINFGDWVMREMSYAFADKEDEAVFNGDGTSTYGGHLGFREAIKGLSGTIANIAGLVVGTGNAYSELTLTDFEAVVGRAPAYVDSRNPVWVMHKRFYYEVCARLALAAGGVTSVEVQNGLKVPMFLGYPVIFSQVMPSVEANSQVCALFGSFNDAAKATEVGGPTLATDTGGTYFSQDVVAFRGTNRFGITVHDVGNASATAASRVPGPVVGLITAAS